MRARLVVAGAMVLAVATPAYAHRLDEYLQATLISVGRNRVQGQLRLTPGVAVFRTLIAGIDTDADGVISDAEQREYAARMLRDVSLAIDGTPLSVHLTSLRFASIAEMREGRGDIEIDFDAVVPSGGDDRRLTFENHHQPGISVYLVNALVTHDRAIRITGQHRNYEQSSYRLDYEQRGADAASPSRGWWAGIQGWVTGGIDASPARLLASPLRLGMRHIAEGTDHLLFLFVLMLPAPLVAVGKRWGRYAGVRQGVERLLRIVTAFTVGHSVTLVAAATGLVRVPSGPVEVLIAVSILVSAVHAARPLFPGKEAFVAGGFGLVHGLAFASTIVGYGIDPLHTVLTILGFNLGIEVMQLAVLVVTVPWLLSLARTSAYGGVRLGGSVLAGVAALGWIGERAFGFSDRVAPLIEGIVEHDAVLVVVLAVLAMAATAWDRARRVTPEISAAQ